MSCPAPRPPPPVQGDTIQHHFVFSNEAAVPSIPHVMGTSMATVKIKEQHHKSNRSGIGEQSWSLEVNIKDTGEGQEGQ